MVGVIDSKRNELASPVKDLSLKSRTSSRLTSAGAEPLPHPSIQGVRGGFKRGIDLVASSLILTRCGSPDGPASRLRFDSVTTEGHSTDRNVWVWTDAVFTILKFRTMPTGAEDPLGSDLVCLE